MKKIITILAVSALIASCGDSQSGEKSGSDQKQKTEDRTEKDKKIMKMAKAYFKPLPEPKSFDRPIAKLGKKLYYETALSVSGEMSCNSCHMLDQFGVDHEPTSPGHDGTRGERNSPTVYNAYFHIAQFWDGRADDLKEQAKGPVLNPVEMGMTSEPAAVEAIVAIQDYAHMFTEAFPDEKDPITFDNIAEAIAEFEHTLATPAAFDDYLNGDEDALTLEQRDGLQAFMDAGCTTCHMGPGLGGSMYQKFGLVEGPYWDYTGSEREDVGRFEVTEKEGDKYVFKVPALRNVTKTAPYFHDGSVEDLNEAVKIMGITQLGKELDDETVKSIVTFLESLTGEIPEHALLSDAS